MKHNAARSDSVAQLVEAALECNPQERAQFLEKACPDDPELRAEVESLLCFQQQAERLMQKPAYEMSAAIFPEEGLELAAGDIVDGYRVLSLLGEGGMGEVYLAEDLKLERRVALKVVKHGVGSPGILRHSRKEQKILAGLNHPNIARLYGTGSTPSGSPFFVMEYVEGERLDDYCRNHDLSIPERLALFRKVCGAVSYAHQNLVIHRDIKPANIRVTPEGEPKLLDFGIAKLLDPETSVLAESTMTVAALMTPEYASPEQVRGENITTASDVYALGIVLYELLIDRRPYVITSRNPAEIARIITEQEPVRPSAAVTTTTGNPDNRASRAKLLKGDLDNIVLKTLRKETARRYASVAQFSDDIRRYLEGRPVTARKDTLSYRTIKFIGRNRVAVAAAGLVGAAIITGLIVALWQAQNARQQRDLAQRERLKAERINTFLQRMLSFSNQSITSVSPVAQKRDVTVNEMLDQITPQVEAELSHQPDVRSQVQRTIGSAYASQGRYDLAEINLRAALSAQTQLYGQASSQVADTTAELGVLSYRQGRFDDASQLLEKAVASYRNQQHERSAEYNPAKLALALDHLGIVKFYQGNTEACLVLLNDALQISSSAKLQGNDRRVLTFNKSDLGGALVSLGKTERGEQLLHEAEAEYRQLSHEPPWEFGSTLLLLGVGALQRGQIDEAQTRLLEAEHVLRRTLGDKNSYVANTLDAQALALFQKGDLVQAEVKAREALALFQDVFPDNKFWWATAISTLGDICKKSGRVRDAESYYRQSLDIYEQQPTKNHRLITVTKIQLSDFLLEQNRLVEAQRFASEAEDEARKYLGDQDSLVKSAKDKLMAIEMKQGKVESAQAVK
ncbi:MAG TPA: serine/threonine-protein kinase [Candidatus Babeliales bacterium]|nr:serine/threonine-protein kinase [Candidatus Babeliales bacterium]